MLRYTKENRSQEYLQQQVIHFISIVQERKLPLSDRLSARVPVFTGFPDKKVYSAKDSLLLTDVKNIATYIKNDPFWMAR